MIELDRVRKVFPDGHVAVRDLSLIVPAGTVTALLGPSGCGKTTTLKLINRLLPQSSGRIRIDGEDHLTIDAVRLRRRIGYVVQEGGLFPHLTVRQNVEIVPRLLGWPASRRHQRATELLALVGLDPEQHGIRFPAELSGGQRQRVGFARALVVDPPILLMDEPFAALDPPTRRRLQGELKEILHRLRKTVVLVTHDVDEAFLLADRIAVLEDGRLLQTGTAAELRATADSAVRRFLGGRE